MLGSHLGYNLEHYTKMALDRLGSEVRFLGYREFLGRFASPVRIVISRSRMARRLMEPVALRKFNDTAKRVGAEFEPELVIVIKGEAVLPMSVDAFSQQLGAITALWYPDDPRYFESLSKLIAPHYNFVFTTSKRFESTYRGVGVEHVEYLPFGCEPTVHRPLALSPQETKEIACDICFVGTFSPKRAKLIDALERAGFKVKVWGTYWRYFKRRPNVQGPVFGHAMARIFNAAKIVLNVHDDSDLPVKPNMRVFEASGCRSLLLTDRAFGLEQCFTPDEQVICYDNEAELLDLANYYIQSPTESATIAAKAHEHAYRDHTYDQRVKTVLKTVSQSR